MPTANKALICAVVAAKALAAGALLYMSWDAPIKNGIALSLCAAGMMVIIALVIRQAGREELEATRLARLRQFQRQPEPLQRINAAKKCAGCWGPLQRPYVRDGNGFRSLACCERRRDTEQRRRIFFDPSEIRAARRAGLIGG
jgi:hypothetical protein